MSGLFLLLVAGIWIFIAVKLASYIDKKFPKNIQGIPFIFAMMALIPLPIIDEIIFAPKIKKICTENSKVIIDAPTIIGRTVWFGGSEEKTYRVGTIRLHEATRIYVDPITQENVYHYKRIETSGGWLMKFFTDSGGGAFLFDTTCQPKNINEFELENKIHRINRPL